MRKLTQTLILLLLSVFSAAQSAGALIEENLRQFNPGARVSVALVDGNETTYLGYHLVDSNRIAEAELAKTAFPVGSISKVMTATLLAREVAAGRVALDDTINTYYAFDFNAGSKMTFRQLANHTSGMPQQVAALMMGIDRQNPYMGHTPEGVMNFLRKYVATTPTEASVYSNLGVGLLAYTLARGVHDTTYAALLNDSLLLPLGMHATAATPAELDAPLVEGYDAAGDPAPPWTFTDALVGAGGVLSTAEDMVTFARAVIAAPEGSPLTLGLEPTVRINANVAVGLGWHTLEREGRPVLHWHNGGTGNARAMLVVDRANQRAVVVLLNQSSFHPAAASLDRLGFQLMDIMGSDE